MAFFGQSNSLDLKPFFKIKPDSDYIRKVGNGEKKFNEVSLVFLGGFSRIFYVVFPV